MNPIWIEGMNRSRYVTRTIDKIDRAIIAALAANGRMTVRELAAQIGLSSPSVTERIHKLEDAGAIAGYTISVEPKAWRARGFWLGRHLERRDLYALVFRGCGEPIPVGADTQQRTRRSHGHDLA